MINAIKKELFLRKDELQNKNLNSIYFGGGTPSILKIDDIQSILDELLKYYHFNSAIEITLEANPDDLDKKFLESLSKTYINRLSIGTQFFFEDDLKLMNRSHTSYQAEKSVKMAQDFGFENISIDLIYGIPTSNFNQWKQNLQKAVSLQIPHISSYALTVEPKTALENWIKKDPKLAPKDTRQNDDFYFMVDFLAQNNFSHYEISNFAKKDFRVATQFGVLAISRVFGFGPLFCTFV